MAKNYNQRLIKVRRSYSPSEIAKLFGIDRKTCFRWIKYCDLKVIKPNTNPLLVMGSDLKAFIAKMKKERKTKLQPDEYFCMKCRVAVKAKNGSERIIKTDKTLGKEKRPQLIKVGLCRICGNKINRFLRVYQKD